MERRLFWPLLDKAQSLVPKESVNQKVDLIAKGVKNSQISEKAPTL